MPGAIGFPGFRAFSFRLEARRNRRELSFKFRGFVVSTIAETLARAKSYHHAGQLVQAEALYREVLQADPAHVDALYLLAGAYHGLGKPDQTIASLEQVLRLRRDMRTPTITLARLWRGREAWTAPKLATARRSPAGPTLPRPTLISACLHRRNDLHGAVACYRRAGVDARKCDGS